MIVRVTIFLIVITVVWLYVAKIYVGGNAEERDKMIFQKDYRPWYLYAIAVLVIADMIGILASTFTFLCPLER